MTKHHKVDLPTAISISLELRTKGIIRSPKYIHESGGTERICRDCHDRKHRITPNPSRRTNAFKRMVLLKPETLLLRANQERKSEKEYVARWRREHVVMRLNL